MKTSVLVTGSVGFIGFHLCSLLLERGFDVVGIDALTDYYDKNLKKARLKILEKYPNYKNYKVRIESDSEIAEIFHLSQPDVVVHLAAQAGVRYSIDHPAEYVQTNLVGSFNILEACRRTQVRHLLMASTSSVYGANEELPFKEIDQTDSPMSFYAATKKSNEVMAHSYAHIFSLPITMFRFFTVYGPWGRPDMALYKFIDAIKSDNKIDVYNFGKMRRDFTYVVDLVEAIHKLMSCTPEDPRMSPVRDSVDFDSLSDVAPFRIVNIGNSQPVELMTFIAALEDALGIKADKEMKPIQAGDVPATWADTRLLQHLTGFTPSTPVQVGVKEFVRWYEEYTSTPSN